MKICDVCMVNKSNSEFYRYSKSGKLEHMCKTCKASKDKEHRKTHPRQYTKRSKTKHKVSYGGSRRCNTCDTVKNINQYSINTAMSLGRSWTCKSCTNIRENAKRRANGSMFAGNTNTSVPNTTLKVSQCSICGATYNPIRETHKRCDVCSKLVRDIHSHLSHIRGDHERNALIPNGMSMIDLCIDVATKYLQTTACCYCGDQLPKNDMKRVDHINPICRGGMHELSNLNICCHSCNASKGRFTLQQWLNVCSLVSNNADPDYTVSTVPTVSITTTNQYDRQCSVCYTDISSIHGLYKYCTTCVLLVDRLGSSLTSSRNINGKKVSLPCTRQTIVDIAKRWLNSNQCCYCFRSFTADNPRSVDHIVPMWLVKENVANNLAIACLECNRMKEGLRLDQWIIQCGKIANNTSLTYKV